MGEREGLVVEGDGILWEGEFAAIFFVAKYWVVDGLELGADLVVAAGDEVDGDLGVGGGGGDYFIV